jgi:hypothetical protein
LRGLVPRPSGTAVYNAPGAVAPQRKREANPHGRRNGVKPIRTVVWDPWLALVVSHGDPIGLFLRCDSGHFTLDSSSHRSFGHFEVMLGLQPDPECSRSPEKLRKA